MMWNSVDGSKVAAYLHTNVVSYKDNVALFQQAEKEFGGVDVSIREEKHVVQMTIFMSTTSRLCI